MRRLAPFAVSLAAGLAQAAAIAAPWNGQPQWWLQLASLALLAALLQRERAPLSAAALGWVFALAWLAGTFWWLFISMHVYGGLPAPLAVAAVGLLAAALGLYYALACGACTRLSRPGSAWNSLLFAALWLAAELARGTIFTGFPWGAGGYAHVDGPLAPLAPWVGVYGIGFVSAALAWELVALTSGKTVAGPRWAAVGAALGLLAACNVATLRSDPPPGGPPLTVQLLQGNIPQDEKFGERTGVPFALGWHREQLAAATAALVVAPETAIPVLPRQLPDGYLDDISTRFRTGQQAALVGIPLGSMDQGYTNSVLGFGPGMKVAYRYDKHHLVPFGEFIPPLFKWFTRMMNIPLGDFDRGGVGQRSFEFHGERFAPNICYEDLFGEELAARFADEATAPTVFVNVSNIGWFGNTVAIDQHLHASRMRALEFARPMLRATNTGATVVIDRAGRVTHSLQRHTRGVLSGEVQGGRGLTPFAWWVSRLGLWPFWLLVALVPVAFAWHARRSAHAHEPAGT
ncbi:MAG: apolipoprotein N-acyltransferase [Burkholderiales bacterium]|nr:apolipoprotein N-acyltransferase [Burkholderiales bacterium]